MAPALQATTTYVMPVSFRLPRRLDVAHYDEITMLAVPYLTDRDALAKLLPEPLEPAQEPLVTLWCQMCRGVDFLAGRGYNIVGVNLSAVFNGRRDRMPGAYALVLWENDTVPILVGREFLGAPKLYADIPDVEHRGGTWRFSASEYGTKLLEAEVRGAKAADEKACRQIEQGSNAGRWLCWKYVPRADHAGADVSFATAVRSRWSVRQAWLGEGTHRIFQATWEQAPVSAHILEGLRTLVVREYRPALITRASMDLLIGKTQRLE